MQLTIADVNTTRTYNFEANEKDNSPNTEHLGFDTSQMASTPKMHYDSRECDVTWQRPIEWSATTQGLRKTGLKNQFADFCSMCDLYHTLEVNLIYLRSAMSSILPFLVNSKSLIWNQYDSYQASKAWLCYTIALFLPSHLMVYILSFVREINT